MQLDDHKDTFYTAPHEATMRLIDRTIGNRTIGKCGIMHLWQTIKMHSRGLVVLLLADAAGLDRLDRASLHRGSKALMAWHQGLASDMACILSKSCSCDAI
jgi:hypothetical protein